MVSSPPSVMLNAKPRPRAVRGRHDDRCPEWSQFVGHLGADPQVRRTQDGRPIANLRLATSESWRDKNSGDVKRKRNGTARDLHRGSRQHRRAVFAQGSKAFWKERCRRANGWTTLALSCKVTVQISRCSTSIPALGMIDPRTNKQRFPRMVVPVKQHR